jgi:cytochrome c biogenesis protein CcmG/thiol:disulfide interchange protein DsbE
MPALDAFYRRYRDRGVELIGVSVDRPRDRKDVVKVMQAFSYPAAVMKEASANGFGMPDALPVTYVIDSAGIVRARLRPDEVTVTEKALADAVLPLLPSGAERGAPR